MSKEQHNLLKEMADVWMKAAGESIASIIKADISISAPHLEEMSLREVEYSILEPALFVKSCLTQNMAGTVLLIFRQRDIQIFLNKLMGIDELAKPDFEFDEISLSASNEIMNQMTGQSVSAVAEFLENQMVSAPCQLTISDESGNLDSVIGEESDSSVTVVTFSITIDDMIDSEFMLVLTKESKDNLEQELETKARKLKELEEHDMTPDSGQEYQEHTVMGAETIGHSEAASRMEAADMGITIPYKSNLGLIMNVPLNVSVEVGKTRKKLKDVLGFNNGTVIELEKQADAPVDIIVNGQLIARGQVVVIDDNFGVRITEIVNKKNIFGNGEEI